MATQVYTQDTARGQILNYLQQVQGEIIDLALSFQPYPMNASGKTLQSLEVVPSETGGKLIAADHIIFLETGRGPTSPTGPYPEGEKLIDIISEWISEKGLDMNPYAVTKKIHKEGTRLYRAGGKSGILSIPLALPGLNNLFYEIATQFTQTISSQIYEPINEQQQLQTV